MKQLPQLPQLPQLARTTAISAALVVTACSSGTAVTDDQAVDTGNGSIDPSVTDPLNGDAVERRLSQVGSDEAFYEALREALIAQNQNYFVVDPVDGGGVAVDVVDASVPTAIPESDAAIAPPVAPSAPDSASDSLSADADTSSAGAAGSSTELDVTSTNVQEQGVDEQDFVKTDGEYLYVMRREFEEFYPPPSIDEAPPIVEGAIVGGVQSRSSAPAPYAFGDITLRILSLEPEVPTAGVLAELPMNLTGQSASGVYLYQTDSSSSIVMAATNGSGYYNYWDDSYAFTGASSSLTRVDVTNPALSSITDAISIDGSIISSRRIGNQLFFASRYYPAIPDVNPYSMSPAQWESIVNGTDLSTVLPRYTNANASSTSALVDPAECFVAEQPDDDYYSPDIISLVSVNLDTMQVSDTACYLGSSETLYASPDAVYLATTRWDYNTGEVIDTVVPGGDETIDAVSTSEFVYADPRLDTDIHKFSINTGQLAYEGSGTVSGHLGWNNLRKPHRMSEHNNRLRVITHSATQSSQVSPVNVTVLEPNAEGDLDVVGVLPNDAQPEHIGKPFEELYATKFLGEYAYLVTFRQTDPLYSIDLSDPSNPTVAGELEIDGYSDFLQPVGAGYLLGIGKDAVANEGRGGGAFTQGIKLSLFNVRDASNPVEVQSMVIGQRGSESSALQDQRGITVQAANDLHPTRVAISIQVHGQVDAPRPSSANASYWYSHNYTGLHGFEIRVGDNPGIDFVGALSLPQDGSQEFGFYNYGSYPDRSILVNDATYYINEANIYAADWGNLSNSIGPQ